MRTDVPITGEEVAAWWGRITQARTRREQEVTTWERLLKAYQPPKDTSAPKTNLHFRNVETKKAKLFFQLPDLVLTPLGPLDDVVNPTTGAPMPPTEILAVKQAVLNKLLGRDHAQVKAAAIDPAIFDVLATSGIGATKICYEVDLAPMATPEGEGLGGDAGPGVPIAERWRWYRFSTRAFLCPHDWASTLFDEAPWLAMEFVLPLPQAKRDFALPDDFAANASANDLRLGGEAPAGLTSGALVKGVEVWIKTALFDPTVAHRERYRQLVLIEGQPFAAIYRDSPYQDVDAEGRLTADSMIGSPIHPLTIRDLADQAWVPSDAAFADPLVRQLNTWRSQEIALRDANVPRFLYDESIREAIETLRDADVGGGVGVPADKLVRGAEGLIAPLPHLERAQSDLQGEALVKRDLDESLAIDATASGTLSQKVHSATEIATADARTSERMQGERARVLDWYLRGVRKFDALIQRYADQQDYVQIVGQAGATTLQAWDKTVIAGRFAFDAKPDSQLSPDAAAARKNWLDWTNFTAQSPFANQQENLKTGALAFGYDPSRVLQTPAPSGPPAPSVSITIRGEDFAGPQSAIMLEIAQQAGYQISPQAIAAVAAGQARVEAAEAMAQTPETRHGGTAPRAEVLSSHHGELTGQMAGAGPRIASPMTPEGGQVQ